MDPWLLTPKNDRLTVSIEWCWVEDAMDFGLRCSCNIPTTSISDSGQLTSYVVATRWAAELGRIASKRDHASANTVEVDPGIDTTTSVELVLEITNSSVTVAVL